MGYASKRVSVSEDLQDSEANCSNKAEVEGRNEFVSSSSSEQRRIF